MPRLSRVSAAAFVSGRFRALEPRPFAGRPGVHPVFPSRRREPYNEYWGIFIVSPSFMADRWA